MKKKMLVYYLMVGYCQLVMLFGAKAQELNRKLIQAVKQFETDDQLKHAVFSLYFVDSKTGRSVFDKNSQVGLSPASTQKVITSISAIEFLGTDYKYKTAFGYDGAIREGVLEGIIHVIASGDPTLGSWRFTTATPAKIKSGIILAMKTNGITAYADEWAIHDDNFETQSVPGGWPWEDIGNYYGAGFGSLNWRENQADINLKTTGVPGDSVQVLNMEPQNLKFNFVNELKKGKPGSGDNSCFYYPMGGTLAYLRGTIPSNEKEFTISIAIQDRHGYFLQDLRDSLKIAGIISRPSTLQRSVVSPDSTFKGKPELKFFYTHYSPALDSINYWFLKKSVNLYGEALLKTIALEKNGFGSAEGGLKLVQEFWQNRGIEKPALNMIDGSGLSPQNRITANALVTALQYARTKTWYNSFYQALPEINGIRMKSGSIGGVRSYTGYIKSKSGKEYTFAFIVNNYSGSSAVLVSKMWKVLDVMK